MTITPAMQQYYDLKKQHEDCILFFRMGDFYEMFEEDAQIGHKILGIALTTRNKNAENPILLAGIPFHAKEKYLPLLVGAGYKVAIAEQVSDPKLKGIVKREVVRVVTPATLSLEGESYENSDITPVIISVVNSESGYGISVLNLSDHSWKCSEFTDSESFLGELYKISPSEVVLEKSLIGNSELQSVLKKKFSLNMYYYDFNNAPYKILTQKFGVKNLEGYGIENKNLAQKASALLLQYVTENQKTELNFIQNLSYDSYSKYMGLDEATIKSLDLVYNFAMGSKKEGTLFGTLDATKTPMGKRFLRDAILHPLQDIGEIKKRQQFIHVCKSDTVLLEKIRKELGFIVDLDALLSRLSLGRSGPKDLISLKKSLIAIKNVIELVESSNNKELKKIFS